MHSYYGLCSLRSRVYHEIDLFMGFSWRDWSVTIIPSCLFAFGTLPNLAYREAIRNCLLVVLWAMLYIYSFNLFTQSMSPDEDRINKPDRPIPSGKVSVNAALKRCRITWGAFLIVSILHGQIIAEAIMWILCTIFLGATKSGGHWIGKNVVGMSVGNWALLSASRKLMGAQATQSSQHVVAISIWSGAITQAQDFRDQEGDRKIGRKTFPISFGDRTARHFLAFALIPLAFCGTYFFNLAKNAPWLLGTMHALVACRFLMFRNAKSDHKSYMLVTYIYCAMVAISSLESLGISSPTSTIDMVDIGSTASLKTQTGLAANCAASTRRHKYTAAPTPQSLQSRIIAVFDRIPVIRMASSADVGDVVAKVILWH
ncbi:hypothetical protein RU639_013598 [Aspergillus parasiticus]